MVGITFILFFIFINFISSFLTYLAFKKSKTKTLKFIPSLICLLGVLVFGIGPQVFNYVHGITLGITFLLLGVFFGIAFLISVITLFYLILTSKKVDRIKES